MSAETIPAEVVKLARRVVLHCQNTPPEEATKIVERVIASAFTRPAEPAAPVAEAGDGEVVSWPHHLNEAMDALTSAFQWLKNIRYGISCAEEAVASTEKMIAHVYEAIDAEPPLVRLSTLEAERARADELRRLLTASGRCVDDLTARLDAFEHAQEKARDEGFNHALSILEDALGSPTYYAADGSETWEGDTRGTIYNLLRASGVWRGDDDMLVTKDRDFWKERFQVESRSRIEAEQRAADALARAENAADWQPIEAAPKRRVPFLALNYDGEVHVAAYDEHGRLMRRSHSAYRPQSFSIENGRKILISETEEWRNDWSLWTRLYEFKPTHWRPLPFLPRAAREAQPATDGGDNG